MKFGKADIPPGLRVKVHRPDGESLGEFGYAIDHVGKCGKTMKTDHTYIAVGATSVKFDDGYTRSFWNYHLKLIEGRNRL